jgi:hypothetical protein
VFLGYNPDATFPITRRYQIDYDYYRTSPDFKQIFESKEFKEYFAPGNLNYVSLSDIYVYSDIPNRENIEIDNRNEMQEFMACLDQDFKAQSFEDMASLKHVYATADVVFTYRDETSRTPNKLLNNSVSFRITPSWENTIRWLEGHGYGDRFVHDAGEIEYIELYHYVRTDDDYGQIPVPYEADRAVKVSPELKSMKITDPDRIKHLLDTYETQNINYNDYYYGVIVYKGGDQIIGPEEFYKEYGYDREFAAKYEATQASLVSMQIYFNEGNIPDYVLEYFR